jgi:periplasmic copper chaperone A
MPNKVLVCQLSACLVSAFAAAADAAPALEVSKAWAPAAGAAGADVPVYMTIANPGGEPDSLLRFRCPVANFTEQRTTDYGEGSPAGREIKSIPVPANETVVLAPGGYHLMLLKTTQPLKQGETFSCSLTFKGAGRQDVSVTVAPEGARAAP